MKEKELILGDGGKGNKKEEGSLHIGYQRANLRRPNDMYENVKPMFCITAKNSIKN